MSNTFAYPHIITLNTQIQPTEPDIAPLEFYYRLSPLTYFSLHKHRNDRCIELRIDAVLSICAYQSVIFQYTKRYRYCVSVSIHKYIIQNRILHKKRGRAREGVPPSRKGVSGGLLRENFDLLVLLKRHLNCIVLHKY